MARFDEAAHLTEDLVLGQALIVVPTEESASGLTAIFGQISNDNDFDHYVDDQKTPNAVVQNFSDRALPETITLRHATGNTLFGVALSEILSNEQSSVPNIVRVSCEFIERCGYQCEVCCSIFMVLILTCSGYISGTWPL